MYLQRGDMILGEAMIIQPIAQPVVIMREEDVRDNLEMIVSPGHLIGVGGSDSVAGIRAAFVAVMHIHILGMAIVR
jgi:hypothetical protein